MNEGKETDKDKKKEQMVNKKSTKNDTRVHIHYPETKACDSNTRGKNKYHKRSQIFILQSNSGMKRIEENNLIYSQCEFYSRSRTKCTDFILGIIS